MAGALDMLLASIAAPRPDHAAMTNAMAAKGKGLLPLPPPSPADMEKPYNDHSTRDNWLALIGGISPALAPFATSIIAKDRAMAAGRARQLAQDPIAKAIQGGANSRTIAPILGDALKNQYITKEEFDAYMKLAEARDPKAQAVGSRIMDLNDPANIGGDVLEHDKGEQFAYGPEGKAGQPIGVRNMDGSIEALGARTRATEDASNASRASYARVTAGETAAGQAPYQDVTVPTPSGSSRVISREQFSKGAGFEGPSPAQNAFASQVGSDYGKQIAGLREQVTKDEQNAESLRQARDVLSKGIDAGAFGPMKLAVDQAMGAMGKQAAADRATRTQVFESQMRTQVLGLIKNLGSGSGISDADREYANGIVGGSIKLTPEALDRIIGIQERGIANRRSQLQRMGGEANTGPASTLPQSALGQSGQRVRRYNPVTGQLE